MPPMHRDMPLAVNSKMPSGIPLLSESIKQIPAK